MKRNAQRLEGVLFYPQQREIGKAVLTLRPQGETSQLKVQFSQSAPDAGEYHTTNLIRQGNKLTGQWASQDGNAQGQIDGHIQNIEGGCVVTGTILDQQNREHRFEMNLAEEETQAQYSSQSSSSFDNPRTRSSNL